MRVKRRDEPSLVWLKRLCLHIEADPQPLADPQPHRAAGMRELCPANCVVGGGGSPRGLDGGKRIGGAWLGPRTSAMPARSDSLKLVRVGLGERQLESSSS